MERRCSHAPGRIRRVIMPASLAVIAVLMTVAAFGAVMHPGSRQMLTMWTGAPAQAAYLPGVAFDAGDPPIARLLVAGDVGTGDAEEYETAAAMTRMLQHGSVDGLVLLGDNVYPDGDPERLDDTVFIPFGSLLYSGTELLPVLGNHDIQNGNRDRHMAGLGMDSRWYAESHGDLLFIGLDSNTSTDPLQLAWLDATLAASEHPWKIVAMHHPPYSAGVHGSDAAVQSAFSPVFESYGVDLVLSGHDHDYQRSKEINGVTYVVSGGAAKIRPTSSADFTAASWSVHHFVELLVYEDRIVGHAYGQDGGKFDEFSLAAAE